MKDDILADIRLKMQVENPNYEECYVDGYACGLADIDEATNPYAVDSIEGQYWTEGWWNAFYGEKPLFSLEGANIEKGQPKPHEHKVADFIISFLESNASIVDISIDSLIGTIISMKVNSLSVVSNNSKILNKSNFSLVL